jgi:glycosyltransferase involved in cell wall biosynthesis
MDISVIVPVYNAGEKIDRCVNALKRQQTQRTYEIILVDDGSTDRDLQPLSGGRVRVFRQANQGPAAARNLGVEKARGAIILFTDADCEPLRDWIEQMVWFLRDPCISAVKGSYLTRQKGVIARFVQHEYESKYRRMKGDPYIDFVDTYSAGFVRKDFLGVGKYDTRFPTASVEDQEFSFRMWKLGCRMVFNPEAKVFHTHSSSIWNYARKKFRIGYWKALVLKKHPEKILRDSHTPQSLKFEMVFAMMLLLSFFFCPVENSLFACAFFPLTGFLATISPFVFHVARKDLIVAALSPFLLLTRALFLSSGLLVGALRFYVLNGRVDRPLEEYGHPRKSTTAALLDK